MRFAFALNRAFVGFVDRAAVFIRRVTGWVRRHVYAPTRAFVMMIASSPAFATGIANGSTPLGSTLMTKHFGAGYDSLDHKGRNNGRGRVVPHRRGRRLVNRSSPV